MMSAETFSSNYTYADSGIEPERYNKSLQRARSADFGDKFSDMSRSKIDGDGYRAETMRRQNSYVMPPASSMGYTDMPAQKQFLRSQSGGFNEMPSEESSKKSGEPSKVMGMLHEAKKAQFDPRPTTADPFYSRNAEASLLQRSQSTFLPDRPKSTLGTRSKSSSQGGLDRSKSSLNMLEHQKYETNGRSFASSDSDLRTSVESLGLGSPEQAEAEIRGGIESRGQDRGRGGMYRQGYEQQQHPHHQHQEQYVHGYGLSPVFRPMATHFIPASPGLYPQPVIPPSPAPFVPHVSPYHGGMASPYVAPSPPFDYFRMMSQPQVLSQHDGTPHMPPHVYHQEGMGIPASPYHMPSSFMSGFAPSHHAYHATPGHHVHTYPDGHVTYTPDGFHPAATMVRNVVEFSPMPLAPAYPQSPLQHAPMAGGSMLPRMPMAPAANQSTSNGPRYLRTAEGHGQQQYSSRSHILDRAGGFGNERSNGKPETALQRANRMSNDGNRGMHGGGYGKKGSQLHNSQRHGGMNNENDSLKTNGQMGGAMHKTSMLEELRSKMKHVPQGSGHHRRNSHGHQHQHQHQSQNHSHQSAASIGLSWGLPEIKGMVCDFAKDQYGSRFIQQKLEDPSISLAEKQLLFEEVLPHARALCKDVFGNYVVQKLLDPKVGTPEQQVQLCDRAIVGNVVDLSMHMYGCRVIQKLVEQVFGHKNGGLRNGLNSSGNKMYSVEYQDTVLLELKDMVMDCVRDQNGNHVIQKCIEKVRPITRISFMLDVFHGKFTMMARHPYGCRVVQRVLEHCDKSIVSSALDELIAQATALTSDQYANYVVQHIITHQPQGVHRTELFNVVTNNVLAFSQHKFGSNVVEACLQHGTPEEREKLIDGMLDGEVPPLETMMQDPYANYVVQKVIEKSTKSQYNHVCKIVRDNESSLKRLTYGKHIINKIKQ